MGDRFARMTRMVGEAAMARLAASRVVVVGLGAVGGYCVEALTRSGVGHFRLVDHDVVSLSNINRQLYAMESTLGQKKVSLAAQRVCDINPACEVEPLDVFCTDETLESILGGEVDLVIDAIDSLVPKVTLLEGCLRREKAVLSSMGAALRTDPTKIRMGTLEETQFCPFAKVVRKFLRRRGVGCDIPCVYSCEPMHDMPEGALASLEESGDLVRGRRRRTMGSLPTLTGLFGLTLAHAAVDFLLGGQWDDEANSEQKNS